jgi:hypothetical protein
MPKAHHKQDRHAWAIETARRLRAGEAVDSAAIAEEIEQLGRSDARELESRVTQILEHLLKLRIVAGPALERNTRGWKASSNANAPNSPRSWKKARASRRESTKTCSPGATATPPTPSKPNTA